MKKIILFAILFSAMGFTYIPDTINSKAKNQPQIVWSPTPLTWDDFQGRMKKSDPYDAVTLSAVSSGFSGDNTNLTFEIEALFFPKGSKKKAKRQNNKLLKHEQGHFDITEIFARKLRKSLQNKKYKNYKTIGKEVDKVYNKNNTAWRKFQNLYDKETNHSKNETKQTEWDIRIQNLLTDLDDFKATQLKVDISYLK